MKKLLRPSFVIPALLPMIFLLSFAFITGCNTTPATTAYRSEGVVITTVDTAMQAWADWVKGDHATQAQVDAVKAAYQKYYAAQQVALQAVDAYLASKTPETSLAVTSATQQVAQESAAVIGLIQPMVKGTK